MRTPWLLIVLTGISSGILYFLGGALAALIVGFGSYALASDSVTGIAVWLGPILWSAAAIFALKVTLARFPARAGPIILMLLAGPVVGFALTYGVAGFRASTILAQHRSQAEALLFPNLPFGLPDGCKVTGGSYWGQSDASLAFECEGSPDRVLAFFRENLPTSWRQCRVWEYRHVFVSPRSGGLETSISVDLSYHDQTRFTLQRSIRSELSPEDFVKVRDMKGNPIPKE